ncbi:MAG TPA: hypothetical protein VM557_05080 [Thermoanaerobaculia bacterium]|nr:hypothetical protein [Thermoanaerobaculia bacterium]
MKKLLTMTTLALLVAGAAFAGVGEDRLFVQPNATMSPSTQLVAGASGSYAVGLLTGPSTTNNDDSCDIAVMPAATLLIPYFEVSTAERAFDTIFSITNVTPQTQIAHVTIWTDWSFPVIDFNLWLTGYDVVAVSLFDVIVNGQIPPTGYTVSPRGNAASGSLSAATPTTAENPNFDIPAITDAATGCRSLPGEIPEPLRTAVRTALTAGTYPFPTGVGGAICTGRVGGVNANAVGYVTIDVVNKCSQALPTDPRFYVNDILWDNSLTGDYFVLDRRSTTTAGNWAGGNPMVHIRAIPEGGPNANPVLGTPQFGGGDRAVVAATVTTNFPYTFYDRYTREGTTLAAGTLEAEADRRQPLPALWAARYIEDTPTGATGFQTSMLIWREGQTSGFLGCGSSFVPNSEIPVARVVRYDEAENATSFTITGCQFSPCVEPAILRMEETQAVLTSNTSFFPARLGTHVGLGGWMYLELNGANVAENEAGDRDPGNKSQSWVSVNMRAEGRYGTLYDATMLGNGCSPIPPTTQIRPAANFVPAVP